MSVKAALVFDTPQVQQELDQLALEGTFIGAELAVDDSQDVGYVITDEDHMYIARQYQMVPTEVTLFIVLLYVPDSQTGTVRRTGWSERKRQFLQRWYRFSRHNRVRNHDTVDLDNYKFEFAEEIRAAEERTRQAAERNDAQSQSIRNHVQNQRRFGGMTTRGMERAAQRRAQERQAIQANYNIDWLSTEHWTCPGPDGNPVRWPIAQMGDRHLWDTICWLVRNGVTLFQQYAPPVNPSITVALAAKQWLRTQTVFRALVQAGIRRHLTFPRDVYQYLRDYVLHDKDAVEAAVPWNDPDKSYQADELASFLDAPLDVPRPIDAQREFGKELRDIDLG